MAIEVRDGQSVVVLSGGRKFTVILKGVDAPELKQDFGELSRQHLAYLVLDGSVEIDFSQLQGDHVVGKVTVTSSLPENLCRKGQPGGRRGVC